MLLEKPMSLLWIFFTVCKKEIKLPLKKLTGIQKNNESSSKSREMYEEWELDFLEHFLNCKNNCPIVLDQWSGNRH